jgi:hypothetical protein
LGGYAACLTTALIGADGIFRLEVSREQVSAQLFFDCRIFG